MNNNDKTYFEYVNELIDKKNSGDIGYQEFGDSLIGDLNNYSADNIRKAFYIIEKMMQTADEWTGSPNSKVKTRILSISDLHVPYQIPVETFSRYSGKIDILQLNGDLTDFSGISKFPKAFRKSPIEEMIECRRYLYELIEMLKPKKVVANYGNHDIRLSQYACKKLDNEMQELIPTSSLDYIFNDGFYHYDKKDKIKVFYVPLKKVFEGEVEIEYSGTWWSKIGKAVFAHPKTFASSPLKTAEKALYWFRNEGHVFDTLIMAHTHRVGSYGIGNSMIYEQGAACCVEKMEYNDSFLINSQKKGYMYICQDEDGNNIRELTKVINLD